MQLNQVLETLGLNSFRTVASQHYIDNGVKIVLTNGDTLTFQLAPKPAPVRVVIPTHRVAYFGYPDSTGIGSVTNRRVILCDVGPRHLRGWETSNGADYQFKCFKLNRVTGLGVRVESEEISCEDFQSIPGLFDKFAA